MSPSRHSAARRGWGWQGWTLSIGVHGVLLAWLLLGDAPLGTRVVEPTPMKVSLVTRRPPPAPAQPEPVTAPKPVEQDPVRKVKPRPKRVVKAKPTPAKRNEQAPPPKQQPVTPPPPRFAVSLEATVPGGGVALPAVTGGSGSAFAAPRSEGETRRGGRGQTGTGASEPAPPRAAAESGDPGVTTLPRLISKPSAAQLQSAYPRAAREQGLEGNVQLKILVSASGKVMAVRVLRKAGNGFDAVAQRLVRTFRFAAGRKGTRPVAIWIPWTYKFRLNG